MHGTFLEPIDFHSNANVYEIALKSDSRTISTQVKSIKFGFKETINTLIT